MRRTMLNRTSIVVAVAVVSTVVLISFFRVGGIQSSEKSPEGGGEKVFSSHCSKCHYSDSAETKIGPGLKGLFDREELPVSGRSVSVETVRRQMIAPYEKMPVVADHLTEQQMADVIEYLKTL